MVPILIFFIFLLGSEGLQVIDKNYWKELALQDLSESLKTTLNCGTAKNVILFIGDGMGPNTITAARIYSEGETGYLSWERFPHVGAVKTYAANKQVPDSANTATSMYTGIKTNFGTLGVDSAVERGDCEGSLVEENRLLTIATLAQEAGKSTGIITTTRVTHATPAAMYAHSAERDWECDSKLPPSAANCKDIGRQLVEDSPGNNFNVIFGGGRQMLQANSSALPGDPVVLKGSCVRTDGRDLIAEWARGKATQGSRYAVLNTTKDLLGLDTSAVDHVLGIFHNDFMEYEYLRDKSEAGAPSLEQMTTTAVKVLMKNPNGFLLMVEGGMIDHAHHDGLARIALSEAVELSKTVNRTMELLEASGLKEETLVIVTSDHSHTLTISGYPARGNNILGLADNSNADGVPYTTLTYATSGRLNYHYQAVNGTVVREDPSKVNTSSWDYHPQAAVLLNQNTHGGSDVFVYASGPYAHLFHRMHEQNYINAVMKYALKIGEFSPYSSKPFIDMTSASSDLVSSMILLIVIQLGLFL